jgi:CRISPR-associated protein Cas5d
MKVYTASFEVEGPFAMFSRPETGSTPVSYAVPTFSSLKGLFESVAFSHEAYFHPTAVEVCRPIRFARYVTNYGGPLRKPKDVEAGNNFQLAATVLVDVCYRVHGEVRAVGGNVRGNPCHALQEIFERRLQRGQRRYAPCLGWREMVPTYLGPLRDGTSPDKSVDLTVDSLLMTVFDRPFRGTVRPRFAQNVVVRQGIYQFPEVF